MAFDIIDCAQGSPEWLAARLGRVTGSVAECIMSAPLKDGGEAAIKRDLRMRLALERMTGQPQEEEFTGNKHTRWGHQWEPMARLAVEERTGLLFVESGFLADRDRMIGVSLDGHTVDFTTMLELKCPKSTTHVKYIQAGKIPAEYRWQIIHGMFVSGAERCIFASFDNRMPPGLDLFITTVAARDLPLEDYGKALDLFLASVSTLEQKLQSLTEQS